MLDIWTETSGYDLGVYSERDRLEIPLPLKPNIPTNISFSVISGKLPSGLRLENGAIRGTPFEVPRLTQYRFVIRATDLTSISDRTFIMSITGEDEPQWLTLPGSLPVGTNDAYYIIDSSFIDFKLVATDTDTAAGQKLDFFISSGDGELPPGLVLLPDGRITGFIQPLLAVPRDSVKGYYDNTLYDSYGYDFGNRSTNGYDSFVFDLLDYDFSIGQVNHRKLNRNYEFIATVTDGDTITKRRFRIYVVGDDFFRADNVIMKAGQGTYTADVTYVRAPIFTTPSYLGLRRANNYQTFKIDIFEGFYNELGPVVYELASSNANINGLIQKELPNDNRIGSTNIRFIKSTGVPEVGWKFNFFQDFKEATNKTYTITNVDPLGGDFYRITIDQPLEYTIPNETIIYLGNESRIPVGMEFDKVTGEIFGIVPYQPAVTETYKFTIKATRFGTVLGSQIRLVNGREIQESTYFETSSSRRIFTVDVLGEVESVINWITPSDLKTIDVGYPSNLFVKAETTFRNTTVFYTLEDGKLPPGLSLNLDGEVVGKVNQLREQNTYKGYWKAGREYKIRDIVKQNVTSDILSITRRKNTATVVTETPHNFKNNSIIKINSSLLEYNYNSGIEIIVDKFKIINEPSITGTGPYYVTVNVPNQKLEPLSPRYTSVKGISAVVNTLTPRFVDVKSTSGNGTGARFLISKGQNGTFNYTGLINNSLNPILLVDPGQNYLPGDTITISGEYFSGVDGVNDLTFTLVNGLEYQFKINGNSNSAFNGTFYSVTSTTNSITLLYENNPGVFGTGLISLEVGTAIYEAQTQIAALNYFSYSNPGTSKNMKVATGVLTADPIFYRATEDHSDTEFSEDYWEKFNIDNANSTLITLDKNETFFDGEDTEFDRIYKFKINARDQLNYSAVSKEFLIRVNIPGNTYYSNIRAQPFLKQEKRIEIRELLSNRDIFDPAYIYRYGDANFGIQRNLATLIYAGIETRKSVEYISAMGRNHKPKRFKLGAVKKAVAKDPGTNNVIYEVVYIDLIDPLEKNGNSLPFKIATLPKTVNVTADNTNEFYNGPFDTDNQYWKRPIPFNSTADRTDIIAGDPGTGVKFPSSISIWRKRLRQIETARRERNYLPLWMRSIQPGSYVELDYVPAIVLCYCKPGGADEILLNIKNSEYDFKLLDYTIDRYIIDSVDGYYEDKYLVFRNDRTTIV